MLDLSVGQLLGLPVCQADGGNSIGRVFHVKPSGAYILDSSLRCAAFRMTGDEGAPLRMTGKRDGFVQNDRGQGRDAAFRMTD